MPMMQAIRSLSALDEKTLRRSTNREDQTSNEGPKPFFIMDWLEELAGGQDMEKIARLLKTPTKQMQPQHIDGRDDGADVHLPADPTTPKSSNRKKVSALSNSTSCPS